MLFQARLVFGDTTIVIKQSGLDIVVRKTMLRFRKYRDVFLYCHSLRLIGSFNTEIVCKSITHLHVMLYLSGPQCYTLSYISI